MSTTEQKRSKSQHQPTGRWIAVKKRLAIYLRDQFTCLMCETDLVEVDWSDVTLDHIRPKERGGSNHENNLFTACRSCNCSRRHAALFKVVPRGRAATIRKHAMNDLTPFISIAEQFLAGECDLETAIEAAKIVLSE